MIITNIVLFLYIQERGGIIEGRASCERTPPPNAGFYGEFTYTRRAFRAPAPLREYRVARETTPASCPLGAAICTILTGVK